MIGIPGNHTGNVGRAPRADNPRGADVVIVGAGPAGSTAALLLSRAGYDVSILDRHAFPRPKPCGDCLSAGATAVLARLGLLDSVLALPHARLSGWRIVAPGGTAFSAGFGTPGRGGGEHDVAHTLHDCALSIERALLDAALLDAATAAGARFTAGVRVTDLVRDRDGRVRGVADGTRSFPARLVIGADGLRSVVARRLGAIARTPRLRKLSLTLHLEARPLGAVPRQLGEMHCGDGICAGIAPVREDGSRCNLTVVAGAARFGRRVADDAHAFVRSTLAALPRLRHLAAHVHDDLPILASGPFDRPTRRVVFDGAALVGDAAGYYDPFTGQGVFRALTGAELLARTADSALRAGDCTAHALQPYARALRRSLRTGLLVQRGIEAVLARPRAADRAIERIRRAPAFADAIIAVTGDTAPPLRLLSPRVLASLIAAPETEDS